MVSFSELLEQTSRTFALAIPLLPEPLRGQVGLAYLLFRVADTLEDAEVWPRAERLVALQQLELLLRQPEVERARALSASWLTRAPHGHPGYLALLRAFPELLAALLELPPAPRSQILTDAGRTVAGMARAVAAADAEGRRDLESLEALRDYCYVVAGIVGELLTALFLLDSPQLLAVADRLGPRARAFGEGLQLVNILKDQAADAGEGRQYLPGTVPRAEILALAQADLEEARRYIAALRAGGAPSGYVAFTALSAELAVASLEQLASHGPGSKISRETVFGIVERVQREAGLR